MFGLIIHYGIYSIYGYDDISSAKKRRTQNGSEWYYGRLIDKNDFRPISGHKKTKEHHSLNYGNLDYFHVEKDIITDPEIVKEWVSMASKLGAGYIILTSKHHDGYCLWDTNTPARKSKLDIIEVFSEECKRQNMKYGFYYSWFQFDQKFTVDYYYNFCVPQIKELLTYKPQILWFDGQWKMTQKSVNKDVQELLKSVIDDGIEINDRVGYASHHLATFNVGPDRYVPTFTPEHKWQHINTIGLSWGYNKEQTNSDYKTGNKLFCIYKRVKEKKGDFLLNIGPKGNGMICPEEKKSLIDFCKLL